MSVSQPVEDSCYGLFGYSIPLSFWHWGTQLSLDSRQASRVSRQTRSIDRNALFDSLAVRNLFWTTTIANSVHSRSTSAKFESTGRGLR